MRGSSGSPCLISGRWPERYLRGADLLSLWRCRELSAGRGKYQRVQHFKLVFNLVSTLFEPRYLGFLVEVRGHVKICYGTIWYIYDMCISRYYVTIVVHCFQINQVTTVLEGYQFTLDRVEPEWKFFTHTWHIGHDSASHCKYFVSFWVTWNFVISFNNVSNIINMGRLGLQKREGGSGWGGGKGVRRGPFSKDNQLVSYQEDGKYIYDLINMILYNSKHVLVPQHWQMCLIVLLSLQYETMKYRKILYWAK